MTLKGLGVSPGIARGTAVHFHWRGRHVFRVDLTEGEVDREIKRLHRALRVARRQLQTIKRRAERALGKEHAYILDAHLLMLEDQAVIGEIEALIRASRVNAEWAVKVVTDRLVDIYSEISDDYLRARVSDIEDVGRRLISVLLGTQRSRYHNLPPATVLVTEELLPSALVELDLRSVVGFITGIGGSTSHTAIIARSLGIPAVVGLHEAIHRIENDVPVIVDGTTGSVIVSPTPEEIARSEAEQKERERRWSWLGERLALPAETLDGVRVTLRANIELPSELDDVARYGASGIGLFRSEFLYLQAAPDVPSEETQFEIYKRVAEAAGPSGAVIRTVDWDETRLPLGTGSATPVSRIGDVGLERNPALGLRGIRFSLAVPDLFRTQLRAIVRASAYGTLRIVLPLITGVEEFRQARRILTDIIRELRNEGQRVADTVALGAMIEVPAAVLLADHLARECDFFSLGTNDLTQYLLAVDRDNDRVAHLYDPLHPAILRALHHTIRAAEGTGIPVEVCGEMAADPLQALVLLGLGVRIFSMRPRAIPVIKEVFRSVSIAEVTDAVSSARECASADEVRACLRQKLADVVPDAFPLSEP
ncbi:MAG TPA: phosphoenolpyruvate--protein phosphotransferase [Blastocatellia bacterium]|nr:phosphoenolpyruvate--protein phosphotransferase [Blastocatellia bacterium]